MKKMYLLCGFFVCDDKNDDLSNRTTGGRMRPRYAAEEKFLAGKEREERGGRGLFAVAAAFDARSFHLETLGGVRLEMRANRGCCNSASAYLEVLGSE